MKISEYSLPDIELLRDDPKKFLIWRPDKMYIILGASNHAEEALYMDNVSRDAVTIMKRLSGGQTVILTPNNLIIAVVFSGNSLLNPKNIFNTLNRKIISTIEEAGIRGLSLMGISDIAIEGKKILGSAIYRSKVKLLYHAVLNFGEPSATFERYLKHPSREPDYRIGRTHTEFVTSLKEKGYAQSMEHLESELSVSFESLFG
jgi:lipoate-protein ligase A